MNGVDTGGISRERDEILLSTWKIKKINLSRGICDNTPGKNPIETGEKKKGLPEINFNKLMTFNELPDRLRSKIKIMRKIKRDSGRDDRIQRKSTYGSLLVCRNIGRFFLRNRFRCRPCLLRMLLNGTGVIRP